MSGKPQNRFENECPSCDSSFRSEKGLRIHHSVIHGKRLDNRKCEECCEEFYSKNRKKYCSKNCRYKDVDNSGENNPNYQDKKKKNPCKICGNVIEYYESDKKGLYCSICVKTEKWRTPPRLTASQHPRWNGGRVTLRCHMCGSSFERYPSDIVSEKVFCGRNCSSRWLTYAFRGRNHPNWTGGGNQKYGKGWNEARSRALERDDYSCVVCGISKGELGRNPDVHHIIPVQYYVESTDKSIEDAHFLENLASLCISCHRKAEFGKISDQRLYSLIDRNS